MSQLLRDEFSQKRTGQSKEKSSVVLWLVAGEDGQFIYAMDRSALGDSRRQETEKDLLENREGNDPRTLVCERVCSTFVYSFAVAVHEMIMKESNKS